MSDFKKSDCVDVTSVDGKCGFYGHRFMSGPDSSVHDFLVVRKTLARDHDEPDRLGYVNDVIVLTFTEGTMVEHIREALEWRISLIREFTPLDDIHVLTTDPRWSEQDSLFTF